MLILGINAYHAEASAALVKDGYLIAAAEEERFARIKHVAGFPTHAIRYCLKEAGVRPTDLDAVAISKNPWAHVWLKSLEAVRRSLLFPSSVQDRLSVLSKIKQLRSTLGETLGIDPEKLKAAIHFVEHHRAHMASSFYPSGWDRAVVLSLDGFGDFLSGSWGIGEGNSMRIDGEVPFPHSLGILYTALTQFLGFPEWGAEYKVMGLAAYGNPEPFRLAMGKLVSQVRTGAYQLNLHYFRHHTTEVPMAWESGSPTLGILFSDYMEQLLGPRRLPGAALEERHADMAAALQERLEHIVLELLRQLGTRYRQEKLCYAGGVALNCVLNGRILRETPFREVFIQPAAHDAGTSLGAAFYAYHQIYRQPRKFTMNHAAWGPEMVPADCRQALQAAGLSYAELPTQALCDRVAQALTEGKIIGWFQGRMEFGPRALGHRSLIADPRDPTMKARINERVKRRESFRPFAPSILAEKIPDYFSHAHPDPYMLFAYPIRPERLSQIPSVAHVDGTGRLQAVQQEAEPLYRTLIRSFEQKTGVPVILNTSFNEQEPIVCKPEEAIHCFQRNAIDGLALGPFWVERESSPR